MMFMLKLFVDLAVMPRDSGMLLVVFRHHEMDQLYGAAGFGGVRVILWIGGGLDKCMIANVCAGRVRSILSCLDSLPPGVRVSSVSFGGVPRGHEFSLRMLELAGVGHRLRLAATWNISPWYKTAFSLVAVS